MALTKEGVLELVSEEALVEVSYMARKRCQYSTVDGPRARTTYPQVAWQIGLVTSSQGLGPDYSTSTRLSTVPCRCFVLF